jgi:hypothetical protein
MREIWLGRWQVYVFARETLDVAFCMHLTLFETTVAFLSLPYILYCSRFEKIAQ